MTGYVRLSLRLLLVLAWTLFAMAVQGVLLWLPGQGKVAFAQAYWRGIARILGLRITLIGQVTMQRPVVFVANHCSWLDIIAFGCVLPGCFVAKGQIAHWPFINWIAKLGRTVFVSRGRATLAAERNLMAARLQAGDNIILFPEGTTSDGARVLPFQSAFLVIAQAPSKPAVQLATLVYDGLDGLPVRRRDRARISWYGDMDLVSHFPGIGRLRSLHATIVLDPAIPAGTIANRKLLASILEDRLAQNAAALRQGRQVNPQPGFSPNPLDGKD